MPRIRRSAVTALVSGLLLVPLAACSSGEPQPSVPSSAVTTLPTETPSATTSTEPTELSDPSTTAVPEPTQDPGPTPDVPTESPSPDTTSSAPAPSPPPATGSLAPVTVTTSYWGIDPTTGDAFANGYADTVDEGGRCTVVLTNGSTTVEESREASPDATTTSCGEMTVPASKLSSGTWSVTITFASPTSSGQSAPVEIVVP